MLKYIVLLGLSILLLLFFTSIYQKKEHFYNEIVAIGPNQFIQSNNSKYGNNKNDQMSSRFLSDNMDLAAFFKFDKKNAKFYPNSNRMMNDYNQVPLVI